MIKLFIIIKHYFDLGGRGPDYRRFDSGGPGSGERWGPNGPPISSTASSVGANGMGPQQGYYSFVFVQLYIYI